MSYIALCTFDLKNASYEDYKNVYLDLEKAGLKKVVAGKNKNVVIPTTTVLGEFTGISAVSVEDFVRSKVKALFNARGLSSEIFVLVGGDWAWGSTVTG
jgi:hypothetical protein